MSSYLFRGIEFAHGYGVPDELQTIVAELEEHCRAYRRGDEEMTDYPYVPALVLALRDCKAPEGHLVAWVEELLNEGAEADATLDDGRTALHLARSARLVDYLLEQGGDVDARDDAGRTPLHECTTARAAELLLDAGADVNAEDNEGCTPLDCARRAGRREVARLLAQNGGESSL
ncbi:MAG: ankyrin repeat domain-containing protein [Akkermansia muciniphila]